MATSNFGISYNTERSVTNLITLEAGSFFLKVLAKILVFPKTSAWSKETTVARTKCNDPLREMDKISRIKNMVLEFSNVMIPVVLGLNVFKCLLKDDHCLRLQLLDNLTQFILCLVKEINVIHRIYPAELQLNKANASDTEDAFLDLT